MHTVIFAIFSDIVVIPPTVNSDYYEYQGQNGPSSELMQQIQKKLSKTQDKRPPKIPLKSFASSSSGGKEKIKTPPTSEGKISS